MSERETKELQKIEEKNESVLRPNDITGKSAQLREFVDRVLNEQVKFQNESYKTALNAVLLEGKASVEGRAKNVVALRIEELQARMLALLDEYNLSMDDDFRKLTDIKTVSVRAQKEEFLVQLSAKFYKNLEELIDGYRARTEKGLKSIINQASKMAKHYCDNINDIVN